MIPGFQERNVLVYVIQSFANTIYIDFILNPVKLSETCIVVIVPVCPDYGIYTRKLLPEKLLPEVGACINKNFALPGLHKDRKTKALALSTFTSISACGAVTPDFGRTLLQYGAGERGG